MYSRNQNFYDFRLLTEIKWTSYYPLTHYHLRNSINFQAIFSDLWSCGLPLGFFSDKLYHTSQAAPKNLLLRASMVTLLAHTFLSTSSWEKCSLWTQSAASSRPLLPGLLLLFPHSFFFFLPFSSSSPWQTPSSTLRKHAYFLDAHFPFLSSLLCLSSCCF